MTDAQQQLVLQHRHMVPAIAWPLTRRIRKGLDVQDVLQAGRLGLCEAAARWQPARGVPFSAFARLRIHGRMVDLLRAHRPVAGVARTAWESVPTDQWSTALIRLPARLPDLDAAVDLQTLLRGVPDVRSRYAVLAHVAGFTLQDIGAAIGVCESRASQLRAAGVDAMRARYLQAGP